MVMAQASTWSQPVGLRPAIQNVCRATDLLRIAGSAPRSSFAKLAFGCGWRTHPAGRHRSEGLSGLEFVNPVPPRS